MTSLHLSVPALDHILIGSVLINSGLREQGTIWLRMAVLSDLPDALISPEELRLCLYLDGVDCRHIVGQADGLPDPVRMHAENGRVVLCQMRADWEHDMSWWSWLHRHDDQSWRLACYIARHRGRASCVSLAMPRTGHYLCVDLPARPWAVGLEYDWTIMPN